VQSFREKILGSKFTITAELTLARDSTASELRRQVEGLKGLVDGIQVADNPWAWVQMSSVAASALVLQQGVDAIPVLSCRDRNRLALQSDLLGLRALGVSSAILVKGHRMPKEHQVPARSVFELSGKELVAMGRELADEISPGPVADFLIGTNARVFRPQPGWQPESLGERARAGAQFMQTQLCLNIDTLRLYMQRLVEARLTWKYAIVATVAVMPSAKTAQWLKLVLKDALVPPALVQRLEEAADPEREGVSICAEAIREIAEIPGVSGVHVFTTGEASLVPEAIRASGLRGAG
jgi:5,10-methylenetetrahydrofolate reductase